MKVTIWSQLLLTAVLVLGLASESAAQKSGNAKGSSGKGFGLTGDDRPSGRSGPSNQNSTPSNSFTPPRQQSNLTPPRQQSNQGNVGALILGGVIQGLQQQQQMQQPPVQRAPASSRPGFNDFNNNGFAPNQQPATQGYVEGQQYYLQDGRLSVYRGGQFVPLTASNVTTGGTTDSAVAPAPAPPAPQLTVMPAGVPAQPLKPAANSTSIPARLISQAELGRGRKFVAKAQEGVVVDIESELESLVVDPAALVSEMAGMNVEPQLVAKLQAAIQSGDATQAQLQFVAATQNLARGQQLFRQVSVMAALETVRSDAESSELKTSSLRALKKAIQKSDAKPEVIKHISPLIARLENLIEVDELLGSAVPGNVAAQISLTEAKQRLILNPGMDVNSAVSLGNGSVLVGTGGVGELEMRDTSLAEVLGLPVLPLESSEIADSAITSGVILTNPARTGTPVFLEYNGQSQKLESGKQFVLDTTEKVAVKFNRGGNNGWQTYTLEPGNYQFKGTAQGWDLESLTYELKLDNTSSPLEFHFVWNGERRSVPSRELVTLTSKLPIRLSFDRGNGEKQKSFTMAEQKQSMRVGLNAGDRLWDIFSSTGESVNIANDTPPAF